MIASVVSFGQVRTPVFASKEDSVQYEKLNLLLLDAFRNPRYTSRIDSIGKALALFRDKAIRYRTSYRPTLPAYTRRPADLSAITKISISGDKVIRLPDSVYLMKNLAELELVNTRIKKLPTRLSRMPALKKITLLNNRPKRKLRLGKNPVLETLVIHDDEMDRRPRNYRKLSKLKTLDLGRNNLSVFPEVSLPNLTALVLTANAIRHVPSTIALLPNLVSLDLMSNQIETLPPEIGRLQHLENLLLYKNNLSQLNPAVYRLKNLKVIDLYYNQLEQLDTAIRNWKNLEILYVSNNKLFSLPENMGELSMLRQLYIHHNRLSALPQSIGSLDSLRVLRANENRLLEFPSSILGLQALENLDMGSNQIPSIPMGVFDYPQIKILRITGNPISGDEKKMLRARALKLMEKREVVVYLEGLNEPPE